MAKKRGPYSKGDQPPTRLAAFLLHRGMTQAQVRKVTGLSAGRVSAALQGKKTTPETLLALSKGLKAPPAELTDDNRLIIQVATRTASDRDLEILAQTASAVIEQALRDRK